MELYSGVILRVVWESSGYKKRIIRIMTECRSRDFCRELFIDLKILPQLSLYIYHLILFVNKNNELYTTNNEIHNYCTRHRRNLHQPAANLAQYQNGVLYRGVRMYNSLPAYIKNEYHNPKILKEFWKGSYIVTHFNL
jgi:hypothetical protein